MMYSAWERPLILGNELPLLVASWPEVRSYIQGVPSDASPKEVARELRIRFPSIEGLAAWAGASAEEIEKAELPEEAVKIAQEAAELLATHPIIQAALKEVGEFVQAPVSLADSLAIAQDTTAHSYGSDIATIFYDLGHRLSKWDYHAALMAIQYSIKLNESLIAIDPETYRPRVGSSLSVKGNIYLKEEQFSEAAEAFAAGLQTLLPLTTTAPPHVYRLMFLLSKAYIHACQQGKIAIDESLLQQALQILGAVQIDFEDKTEAA